MKREEIRKTQTIRGKGPLFGWRGPLEETTDTFDIGTFLKTDGPTTAQEFTHLLQAIAEGGTFGDYRRVEGENRDRVNFFVYGPNSILFMKKRDVPNLVQAIEALRIGETANPEQMQVTE
ncbi:MULTISPECIES: hypothetical protein [unclassified Bradyrhizobium]|uniref:hypothetical protein n=1 Tax=unclassified Bradyrhizobium TaxID=2631580 RepID=UPI00339A1F4C